MHGLRRRLQNRRRRQYDSHLMTELITFLRPLYQELDGASRLDTVERLGAIARRLAPPSPELELLIFFHPLGNWLDKVGNVSRAVLTLRNVAADRQMVVTESGGGN